MQDVCQRNEERRKEVMNIETVIATVYYLSVRLVLMYGMYCICSACGAYLKSRGTAPFRK